MIPLIKVRLSKGQPYLNTKERFEQLLNDFWWDMTYVAKCLARDDLFYAKFMSESVMRTDYLVPLTEWYIASAYNWNITTNKHGRLFKKYLPSDWWKKIERTFSGSNINDNWRALFAYADVASQMGAELSERLEYQYPEEVEMNIRKYLEYVKSLSLYNPKTGKPVQVRLKPMGNTILRRVSFRKFEK